MTEESKRIRRAKRWEQAELNRAARSYSRYLRAVEFRKLVEAQEQIEAETEELKKRIAETAALGASLQADIARVTKDLTILEGPGGEK